MYECNYSPMPETQLWLTHWGRDKMAAISQTTLSIAIFVNENVRISIEFSVKFVPKGPINNIPALVQIIAWRRPGDKSLSEPVMVSLLTHICVTRPQWVNYLFMAILVAGLANLCYWKEFHGCILLVACKMVSINATKLSVTKHDHKRTMHTQNII